MIAVGKGARGNTKLSFSITGGRGVKWGPKTDYAIPEQPLIDRGFGVTANLGRVAGAYLWQNKCYF